MVLRAGFKKKLRLHVELKIYDKNRRKITGPQCVKLMPDTYKNQQYINCYGYDRITKSHLLGSRR
jgi:hypothetical protein